MIGYKVWIKLKEDETIYIEEGIYLGYENAKKRCEELKKRKYIEEAMFTSYESIYDTDLSQQVLHQS